MKGRRTEARRQAILNRRGGTGDVIVLDRFKDEWAAAAARAEREEREWCEALWKARHGSESQERADESWDEDEEWEFRLALVRTGFDAFVRDPQAEGSEPVGANEDETLDMKPDPELLQKTVHEEETREVVVPRELLDKMMQ